MPVAADSPMTWAMMRRVRQPSALRVPNSAVRRDTAAIVSRLATANAAISTSTASHRPRSLASLAALVTDPATRAARLLALSTVVPGSSRVTSRVTSGTSAALAASR
jgi:hypothetical protein